ncbi:NAD(P)-dependent glycerol-3-phosphate dehydrogenase [Methylocapsa sp. D3K7]|uniref:NAD(P)H-dependent glycerol-3-phosphate dehydrogenase n=1 Tax=Methylocapsa sp. D3K7 TaxID=3041435 RepID=UPI00244E653C|nr:NAD(P)H-dependent glycerol-3-phosphate dehydrogenase [Methylocapsa sp. D3K7]WGJ15697.1 NAD(P)-dependent glycerol-3-phosphate dehydrogenase [Methylocapsa sp. D3K7]
MPPSPTRRIAVLGAGAWGTALANLAARPGRGDDVEVALWARDPAHVVEMMATGINARHLPGVPILSNVRPISEPAEVHGCELILAVIPAQALRPVLELFAPYLANGVPIVVCAKGIENTTGRFLSEVAAEILPDNPPAILSGPSFATEVAQGLPTAVTVASWDGELAAKIAGMLAAPTFRLYSSPDVRGVEIGGAAKNVLAIASGIAAGRGLGASAGAALIARGFAELSRFGRAHGAKPSTLAGLSGLGDLVLTCTSAISRNYAFGVALGRGLPISEAVERSGLCEGVHTCGVLVDLAHAKEIDMPIAAAVDAVLAERISIEEAITLLLARPSKAELDKDD